jgi:hypothetical protein
MNKTKTPLKLWDFCTQYVAKIRCLTAQPLFFLHGRTPYELVTGNTPDISEYIAFHWYQPVYYFDNSNFPESHEHIGRWIGVAHNIGQALCFWILPKSGTPIARTTVRAISEPELQTDPLRQELEFYDPAITRKIGDHVLTESDFSFELDSNDLNIALMDVDDIDNGHFSPMEPEADCPEIDDFNEETLDNLLLADVLLPRGDFQFIGPQGTSICSRGPCVRRIPYKSGQFFWDFLFVKKKLLVKNILDSFFTT